MQWVLCSDGAVVHEFEGTWAEVSGIDAPLVSRPGQCRMLIGVGIGVSVSVSLGMGMGLV